MSYEAILFDFDGVLIDTEPLHFECWREVMAPLGLDLDWPAYDAKIRGLSADGLLEALRQLAEPPLEREAVRATYPVKIAMFRERVLGMENLIGAEVVELLAELEGKYRLGVVSSGRVTHVVPLLERGGILDRFGVVICQEDVTEIKPSPQPYLKAAQRLGVSSALVVEDSDAGAASGQAAGFDVLRVERCEDTARVVRGRLGLG